jgi:hypothetical protein
MTAASSVRAMIARAAQSDASDERKIAAAGVWRITVLHANRDLAAIMNLLAKMAPIGPPWRPPNNSKGLGNEP